MLANPANETAQFSRSLDSGSVPRLILLNGPPGIGKSTLAQRWADDHPGTLNLDIDQLRGMIGGWRDRFGETGGIVRPLALAMVGAHIGGGRDVIMPQFLGRPSEIERFAATALAVGGEFREIVLMDSRENALDRFGDRGADDEQPWHRYIRDLVDGLGGRAHLAGMYDQFTAMLAARPQATVLPTTAGAIELAYQALTAALA